MPRQPVRSPLPVLHHAVDGGGADALDVVAGLPAIVGNLVVDVEAAGIHLHRQPQGFVDRRAVVPAHVRPGHGEVMLIEAADRVAHLTAPLVERLSDELPVGPVALWGGVADVLAAYVLWFARQRGGDQRRAWCRSESLLDRLAQIAPVRHRPRQTRPTAP